MKKAKYNISCDNKVYKQGEIYSAEEVAHLDQSDFEDTEEVAEQKVEENTQADENVPTEQIEGTNTPAPIE